VDVPLHPVTFGLHPDDACITTRYKKEDITEGITGAVHECGHAFYEQERNPEYDGLPIGDALSMGVHESQSLLWERMVALSPAFVLTCSPRFSRHFLTSAKVHLQRSGAKWLCLCPLLRGVVRTYRTTGDEAPALARRRGRRP
jgi:Zn-dependent M32 family carboxypeptidase